MLIRERLKDGLVKLARVLFAAGAVELRPPVPGVPKIRSVDALETLLQTTQPEANAIHLFSSCPMGGRADCPVDAFGHVKASENVYVNDASLLPTPTGVNPQTTIQAIARRNALHFLAGR